MTACRLPHLLRRDIALACLAGLLLHLPAQAQPIGPGDFGSNPSLITFNGITNACSNVISGRFPCGGAPWTIGDVTFSHVGNGSFDGWSLPNFGIGLGQSLADNEYRSDWTLQFARPFTTIGLQVMLSGQYAVSFFREDTLLGAVSVVNGSTFSRGFAGWFDEQGITRIRIEEAVANNTVMAVDNIRWEGVPLPAVPEPGTWAMLLAGLAVVGRLAVRR